MQTKRTTFSSSWLPYALLAPQVVITLVFFIWPASQALYQSVLRQDAFGLRTEFVALANPFTDDLAQGMPMRLLLDGTPRPDAQVELWARAPDGTVAISYHRTDAEGIVVLPVRAGHVYMADAVTLEAVEPVGDGDPEWLSLWANLTFAVP